MTVSRQMLGVGNVACAVLITDNLHPSTHHGYWTSIPTWLCSTHLLRGPLAAASMEACRTELLGRVDNTVNAAQAGMPRVFDDHVHQQVQGFIGFLTRDGSRYR